MSRAASLTPEFVEFVPNEQMLGVLYVSMQYCTAVHKCACGCGKKVVTPISPTGWKLVFDGETVSLSPSIGNWAFPCKSHYWVERNRIRWAPKWAPEQVAAGRAQERLDKQRYYGQPAAAATVQRDGAPTSRKAGLWEAILKGLGLT